MNEYRILGEPMKFETIAIHGGYSPETTTNAVVKFYGSGLQARKHI